MIKLKSILLELTDYEKLRELEYAQEREIKELDAKLHSWYKQGRKLSYKAMIKRSKMIYDRYTKLKDEILNNSKDPYSIQGNINAKYMYHYTTGDALFNILKYNEMECDQSVSFTTNPNLYRIGFIFWHPNEYTDGKNNKNVGIKIKFDLQKMKKDKIRIRPGSDQHETYAGEEELYIPRPSGILKPVIKYIVDVIIIKDKENIRKYPTPIEDLEKILKQKNIKYKIV